jgi:hypothetical protein
VSMLVASDSLTTFNARQHPPSPVMANLTVLTLQGSGSATLNKRCFEFDADVPSQPADKVVWLVRR